MRLLLVTSLLAGSIGCAARAPVVYRFQPVAAQPADKAKLLAVAPQLVEQFRAAKASAMVAGIVLDGELVYARAFGVRDPQAVAPVDLDSAPTSRTRCDLLALIASYRPSTAAIMA